MAAFTFETSGTISVLEWDHLTPIAQRRVEAAARAFWDDLGDNTQEAMVHLGHTVGFSDFTPRALVKVIGSDLPVTLAINADGHLDLEETV